MFWMILKLIMKEMAWAKSATNVIFILFLIYITNGSTLSRVIRYNIGFVCKDGFIRDNIFNIIKIKVLICITRIG